MLERGQLAEVIKIRSAHINKLKIVDKIIYKYCQPGFDALKIKRTQSKLRLHVNWFVIERHCKSKSWDLNTDSNQKMIFLRKLNWFVIFQFSFDFKNKKWDHSNRYIIYHNQFVILKSVRKCKSKNFRIENNYICFFYNLLFVVCRCARM